MRVDGQGHAPAALLAGRTLIATVKEGPAIGLDKSGRPRPTRVRTPDLPASNGSLYRQRYSGRRYYTEPDVNFTHYTPRPINFNACLKQGSQNFQ